MATFPGGIEHIPCCPQEERVPGNRAIQGTTVVAAPGRFFVARPGQPILAHTRERWGRGLPGGGSRGLSGIPSAIEPYGSARNRQFRDVLLYLSANTSCLGR